MYHPNELDQQIENLRTLQQSYDQIAGAAEAYNVGKTQLAQAITSKGVETSPTESYPEMAEKVNAISQETYQINGGEMYAKQLFGSLETPNYWNLYDVLAQLLSDGRLVYYGGILLAEYYKGYDSLALSGAGAGGAYVVSDKDSEGNFIMYTEDITHIWSTEFDGKGNRWVAYCFADEYHNFEITNTSTSPRSIFIGRKVGTITSLVNGRISQIIVPDGNELVRFDTGSGRSNTKTQNFAKNYVLRNIKNVTSALGITAQTESVYIEAENINLGDSGAEYSGLWGQNMNVSSLILKAETVSGQGMYTYGGGGDSTLANLIINAISGAYKISSGSYGFPRLREISLIGVEDFILYYGISYDDSKKGTRKILISYSTNDKTKAVRLREYGSSTIDANNGFKNVEDIELMNGWNKPLECLTCISLTESNMYAHILQRLKQDEPDCGDGVTITLGSTNLAKLTSEESVQLLDDLTNIYGYTFA